MKTFYIKNDWNDRTLCALDMTWVNDGRASAHFATEEAATEALEYYIDRNPDDAGRVEVSFYELDAE